jgi:hypothetical protein
MDLWVFAQAELGDFGQIGALGGAGAIIAAGLFRLLTADRSLDKKYDALMEGERGLRVAAEQARDRALEEAERCETTAKQNEIRALVAEQRVESLERMIVELKGRGS